jgi:hypothetical protein
MDSPIIEDVESEGQNEYLSDNSSSSTFSFKKKKMSFYLSKLIDKSEPFMDESSGRMQSKYYGKVNETIEEEEDDDNPD